MVVISRGHEDVGIIAKTFTVADEDGRSLLNPATLSNLVVAIAPRTLLELETVEHRAPVERVELADVVCWSPPPTHRTWLRQRLLSQR